MYEQHGHEIRLRDCPGIQQKILYREHQSVLWSKQGAVASILQCELMMGTLEGSTPLATKIVAPGAWLQCNSIGRHLPSKKYLLCEI